MIKGLALYIAEKENYNKVKAKSFRVLKNTGFLIFPMFMLVLLEKTGFSISFEMLLFYLYIKIFIQANILGLRAVSRKQLGIYENLLCTGLTFKEIVLIESLSHIRQELFQSCLFNCSIIAGYYLNNLAMGWQTFIILIILANLIANCLHYIVGNMAVILGITKNNLLPLVTIIGWLSSIVLLLAGNQLFKIFFFLILFTGIFFSSFLIMYSQKDFTAP